MRTRPQSLIRPMTPCRYQLMREKSFHITHAQGTTDFEVDGWHISHDEGDLVRSVVRWFKGGLG